MTATAARAVLDRRPAARPEAACSRRRPERCGIPQVEVDIQHLDGIAVEEPRRETASVLLDAALAEPVVRLPYASTLERRFGQPLDWVQVRSGPLVAYALDRLGAQAATRGANVFLHERDARVDVVAHEVIHALQAARGGGFPSGVVDEHAPSEVEAAQALHAPVRPAEGLAPGAIALLRQGPLPSGDPHVTVELPTRSAKTPDATGETGAGAAPSPSRSAALPTATETSAPNTTGAQPSPETEPPGEAFALPPMPELAVSPEQVAARAAALAEAEAGLAQAASAGEVLHAYADAPPTVKAQQAVSLSSRLDTVLPAETREFQAGVPTIDADLEGAAGPPPEPLRVEAPPASEVVLEPEPVAPAPEADLAEVPEPAPFTANDSVGGLFSRLTEPPPEQLADAIGDSLSQVETTDPSVPRSPGPPPDIPLGGETDPARIASQEEAGREQAIGARDTAARAVAEGPGPEQVQPTTVHEEYALAALEPPAAAGLVVPEGPGAYLALGLPPEVQITFDEQQQQAMAASMAEATTKADEATVARDSARDDAVTIAQEGTAALNGTAQGEQTAVVTDARTAIQNDRQTAVDAQRAAVERVEGEAADRRLLGEASIESQVQTEQKTIDDSYVSGEKTIADQVTGGERDARDMREQAERDAENESWWDKAVSFVKEAFRSLVASIGEVFAAVRAAVNAELDRLKQLALDAIDRVAGFVKDAIQGYGDFLKSAVDTLIGETFPEFAAELNAAIDTTVSDAQAAVDVVAEDLKAGVSALVEGLRTAINAALNAYEAAISFAVSVVGAALTGDWGPVLRMALEAVLTLAGVDPESFYGFVGRAVETFEIIVNDPLGFLSNLVNALVGGVQGFADRIGEHLKKGIIDWLTGTLGGAGITLPQTFDLLGVLDIARQVLGLTWERIRAKAVDVIGEKNVARLEFIGGYITTLVTEGWSALWDKITADLSGLLDTVFDAIKSFLLDRVVLAMVKKIPLLFGPVGAIVQLVITAWNLYEFLRDQFSRIVALVQTVVGTIGDIARGVLTVAIAKVEEVLGNFVPVVLDLLAKLLGLGNLSKDVRNVIDAIQDRIDKAIDALIKRVIGLFTGEGQGGAADAAAKPGAPQSAALATDVQSADPQVKADALLAVQSHISQHQPESIDALHELVAEVYRQFQPRGLKALWLDVKSEATLDSRLMASASEPEQRVIAWSELFGPEDVSKELFESQPRNETHAALSVDGKRVGDVQMSDKDHHAETNLVSAHWQEALDLAMGVVETGKRPVVAIAINRAPCHRLCSPMLADLLGSLSAYVKGGIDFVLAPTGVYEPSRTLQPDVIEAQRIHLTERAKKLGQPASALIRAELNKVAFSEDTTTMPDLRRLVEAGWDIRQLQARDQQTVAGTILAEAAHKLAVEAETKAKVGAA